MRRVGHERKYPKLSPEEKSAVLDDLKEHLRITDRQRSLRELGQEMLESIKKRPTVH